LLGTVYTRVENLQDGLRDIWTCRMTLASAYPSVCCMVAISDGRKKSEIEVSTN